MGPSLLHTKPEGGEKRPPLSHLRKVPYCAPPYKWHSHNSGCMGLAPLIPFFSTFPPTLPRAMHDLSHQYCGTAGCPGGSALSPHLGHHIAVRARPTSAVGRLDVRVLPVGSWLCKDDPTTLPSALPTPPPTTPPLPSPRPLPSKLLGVVALGPPASAGHPPRVSHASHGIRRHTKAPNRTTMRRGAPKPRAQVSRRAGEWREWFSLKGTEGKVVSLWESGGKRWDMGLGETLPRFSPGSLPFFTYP